MFEKLQTFRAYESMDKKIIINVARAIFQDYFLYKKKIHCQTSISINILTVKEKEISKLIFSNRSIHQKVRK